MAGLTILQSGFFMDLILPFLLVFSVVFAILKKTEILGKGKRQVDALVSLTIGLIVVAFGNYVNVITNLSAFLGVGVVVILVFMILTGAFYEPGKLKIDDKVKTGAMWLVAVVVVLATLYYTGALSYLISFFENSSSGPIWLGNIIVIIIIGVAVAAVWGSSGKGSSDGEKK
jgi:hypothetical protein